MRWYLASSRGLKGQWHDRRQQSCFWRHAPSLAVLQIEIHWHPQECEARDLPPHLTTAVCLPMHLPMKMQMPMQMPQTLVQQLGQQEPVHNHTGAGERLGAAALEGLLHADAKGDAAAQLTAREQRVQRKRLTTQRLCRGYRRAPHL